MNDQVLDMLLDLNRRLEPFMEVGKVRAFKETLIEWSKDVFEVYSQESIISHEQAMNDPKFIEHMKRKMAIDMSAALWERSGVDKSTMTPNPEFRGNQDADIFPYKAKKLSVQMVALKNNFVR